MALKLGTAGNDTLNDFGLIPLGPATTGFGDAGSNDALHGFAGHDSLSVHRGNDTVYGGDGDDLIFDRGGTLSGNDFFSGGDGNDRVYAGSGFNTYAGGLGNDIVDFSLAASSIGISNGMTIDLTAGSARAYNASGALVSSSSLSGFEIAVGTTFADLMIGSANADSLYAGAGNDRVFGMAGADLLVGDLGNDLLNGGSGNDRLYGGSGNDLMIGGTGRDDMWGGAGADTFRYLATNEGHGLERIANNFDRIHDFQRGLDRVDVSAIDANVMSSGNQAFRFVGGASFSDEGQIRTTYNAATNLTSVLLNTDSNFATAEMRIDMVGRQSLTGSDFFL